MTKSCEKRDDMRKREMLLYDYCGLIRRSISGFLDSTRALYQTCCYLQSGNNNFALDDIKRNIK